MAIKQFSLVILISLSDTSLDSYGGKKNLKKKSIAKFIELKEKFALCDIWRIRNSKTKRFTFCQKHVSRLKTP